MTKAEQQQEYAIETLSFLKPGDRIMVVTDYTKSARQCRVFAARENTVRHITFDTQRAIDGREPRRNGNGWYISMSGHGYSAAQEIVENLSRVLFNDKAALGYSEI